MRRTKLLFSSILATVLGMGVIGGVVATKNTKEAKKVEAVTSTTVYYAVDTDYTVKCNVKFGTGASDPWGTFEMTKVSGTEGIYKATFDDKWDGLATMQLQLYNGSSWVSQVTPFENQWTSPSVYNNKLYYNGSWVTSFKEVKKTTTLTSSTGRVFFNNSGTHWANGGACAVYAWGGDATKSIDSKITMEGTFYHFSWFSDDNGAWYGYADIPTNITGYKIAKLNSADYVTTLSYDSTNEFTPDSFAYVRYGESSGNWVVTGGAKDDVAGANLMKKVIQAYNTCSSSVLNGYGAYDALNTNFYSHATAAAKSATEKSLSGSTASIQTHFEGMAQRAAGANSNSRYITLFGNLDVSQNNGILIIVLVSALTITAVGGYFFLRRKKQK